MKEKSIQKHDGKSGREETIFDGQINSNLEMSCYTTTEKQNYLLITGKQTQIWRHSYTAPHYLYDINTKEIKKLAEGEEKLQNVFLSEDNSKVAYVKHSNLFWSSLNSSQQHQLTFDGSDQILNGVRNNNEISFLHFSSKRGKVFDWVYEEEFGRREALFWSPCAKMIAFWRTDQSKVKSHHLVDDVPYYNTITGLLEFHKFFIFKCKLFLKNRVEVSQSRRGKF